MKIIDSIRNKIQIYFRNYMLSKLVYKPIYNLNHDLTHKQKKIALVYITTPFNKQIFDNNIYHVNILHQIQIVKQLINYNFSIDIYPTNKFDLTTNVNYDYILGFGENYKKICKQNPKAKKILLVTENLPLIVSENYTERLNYYSKRHPGKKIYAIPRNNYYDMEMFTNSDYGIIMNGTYNYNKMKKYFKRNSYRINVNSLQNPYFNIDNNKEFENIQKNFLWFGSNGFIHKGLDILIDAFKFLPEYTLNIYGIDKKELKQTELTKNIILHERINVNSSNFIKEVVNNNTFVLSLSCSEGMMSSIATCMMHGLIPITTKETGFDDVPFMLFFDSFNVNEVINTIKNTQNLSIEELHQLSTQSIKYANIEYSIDRFDKDFNNIMHKILFEKE